MRGRKTTFEIILTDSERATLLHWQRATSINAGMAKRGRVILLLAAKHTFTDICAMAGMSRPHCYKWVKRFTDQGVEGLVDRQRGRRKATA